MTPRYDTIVIGGGIAGAALAASRDRAGRDVLVLERQVAFRDRVRGEVTDALLVSNALLATDDWAPGVFAEYGAERAERMRRIRVAALLHNAIYCDFTPKAGPAGWPSSRSPARCRRAGRTIPPTRWSSSRPWPASWPAP